MNKFGCQTNAKLWQWTLGVKHVHDHAARMPCLNAWIVHVSCTCMIHEVSSSCACTQHAARACCILAPCPNRGSSHDSLRNKSHQRICMLCADAHISCFCYPVPLGPAIGHLCEFSSFFTCTGYHARVVGLESLELIVVITTGVLRGMGHLRHERAHPVGRRPRFSCFAEVQGTLFLAFGQIMKRGFQPQLFWAPVGFCGVGHHGITKL